MPNPNLKVTFLPYLHLIRKKSGVFIVNLVSQVLEQCELPSLYLNISLSSHLVSKSNVGTCSVHLPGGCSTAEETIKTPNYPNSENSNLWR